MPRMDSEIQLRSSTSINIDQYRMGHRVRETEGVGLPHGLRIHYDGEGNVSRFFGAADSRGIGKAIGLRVVPRQ